MEKWFENGDLLLGILGEVGLLVIGDDDGGA